MTIKKSLIIILTSLLAFSACVRDADKDLLDYPIHITGEIDPQFGIPLVYTEMNVYDVIDLLGDYHRYIDTISDDELIVLKMDTTFRHHIAYAEAENAKGIIDIDGIHFSYDTTLVKEHHFYDLENMEGLDVLNDISISQMNISWDAEVRANVKRAAGELLNDYGVLVYVDDIKLKAFNTDTPDDIYELHYPMEDSIRLNDIIGGRSTHLQLLDNEDATELLQVTPNTIEYSLDVHLRVDDTTFSLDYRKYLLDSLKIESLDVISDISANFPLNMKFNNLEYTIDTTDIDISNEINSYFDSLDSIDGLEAEIEQSFLTLKIENSLPIDAKLNIDICDNNFNVLFNLIDINKDFLSTPPIMPYSNNPSLYVSNGTTTNVVKIELDQQKMELLKDARKIIFNVTASTPTNDGIQQQVALKRSDKLDLKIYAKLHARAGIDIPLTDGPLFKNNK